MVYYLDGAVVPSLPEQVAAGVSMTKESDNCVYQRTLIEGNTIQQ